MYRTNPESTIVLRVNPNHNIIPCMLRPSHPFPKYAALVVASALLLTSCTEGDGSDDEELPGSRASAASGPVVGHVDTVRVTLDEYSIGIPQVLPPGETVLRLESQGFEEHNLLFVLTDSDSVVWQTERRLSPYEKRTVTVDLVPGDYTVVCDFSGHEGRGMFTKLVVKPDSLP